MKPHVRRGKAAKKARQNRAVGRAKVKTAGEKLSAKSDLTFYPYAGDY